MTWTGQANGTRSLTLVNLSCGTNYTVYLNFTDVECIVNETYWFTTINCTSGQCNCSDFYNETELGIYLSENGYIKEDDEVEISLSSSLLSIILTLILFFIFFSMGYKENKRSGGVLMLFSGFVLISFEYIATIYLDALYLLPLLTPISILIIILGVRKWLYPVENEYTKSEGT